jgi:NADH-quinone oxidoreductase subunit L
MFLGAAIGSYANGMFHLMTHAFFKALLFMAAGIVIHALAGEQDIRNMRGIGAHLRKTKWMFFVASLALVGIFPFAGFFSKDSIISAVLNAGWYGWVFYVVALIGTFLTGIYTFRLFFTVFHGDGDAHPHHEGEGPRTMLVPVAILSVLAVIGGWIQFAPIWHPLTDFLAPVVETLGVAEPTSTQEWVTSAIAMALGLAGMGVAWMLYGARTRAVPRLAFAQRVLEHKFYFDELYDAVFYKPAAALANVSRRGFEEPVILRAAGTELGETAFDTGRGVRRLQTGLLRTYVFFLGTGMAVLAIVFLLVK